MPACESVYLDSRFVAMKVSRGVFVKANIYPMSPDEQKGLDKFIEEQLDLQNKNATLKACRSTNLLTYNEKFINCRLRLKGCTLWNCLGGEGSNI